MGNVTAKTSGDIASFMSPAKTNIKSLKVHFSPKQLGTGDPSPDNVRNIIGWDGVNVYQSRKNLCDNSKIKKGYFVSAIDRDTTYVMGHEISYNSSVSVSDYIKVEENSQYTCSFQYMPYSAMGFIFFSEKNEESAISSLVFETDIRRSPYTFIVPSNCKYIRINTINLKDEPQILLELGNTATLYEPYQGTTTSTSWSDNVGTVYGGYVDLAKGELVAEWEMAQGKWGDIKSSTANSSTGYYTGKFSYNNTIKISHYQSSYYKNNICNITNTILWQTGEKTPEHFYCGNTSNTNKGEAYIFGNYDDDVTIQIIVKLAEPIHYSLTPQQLLTFKSENNIWSDTNGQTEVKFWTH